MRYKVGFLSILIFFLAISSWADVCVILDREKDKLSESDQEAAIVLLESILGKAGKKINDQACDEEYIFYHLTFGNSVAVFIKGPEGSLTHQVEKVEDLPNAYEKIIYSFHSGTDIESKENLRRDNITPNQANPLRIKSDSIWYTRLGYGIIANEKEKGAGVSFGFGYRHELDQMAVDISILNMLIDNRSSENQFDFSLIRIGGLYFFSPRNDASPYLGSAISYGSTGEFSGWGIRGEVFTGFEMLRTSDIRMFVEGNAIFPFFMNNGIKNRHDEEWSPAITLSFGVGF